MAERVTVIQDIHGMIFQSTHHRRSTNEGEGLSLPSVVKNCSRELERC